MNLRNSNGKVPIRTYDKERPWKLVPFPNKKTFIAIFTRGKRGPSVDIERYWAVLKMRASGATLPETGAEFGITKERVRQMEAKFLNLTEIFLRTD